MQLPARYGMWLRSVVLPAVAGGLVVVAVASRASTLPGGGPQPTGDSPFTDCYGYASTVGTHAVTNLKYLVCTDGDPTCDQDGTCNGTCRFRGRFCFGLTGVPGCTPPPTAGDLKLNRRCPLEAPTGTSGSACGAFVDFDVPLRGPSLRRSTRARCVSRVTAPPSVSRRVDSDVFVFRCVAPQGGCPVSPSGAFL
jgi:hypothetical protein